MSKYSPLGETFRDRREPNVIMTFAEIGNYLGFPVDHAFLTRKKELTAYGYSVKKASIKAQTVQYEKTTQTVRDRTENPI